MKRALAAAVLLQFLLTTATSSADDAPPAHVTVRDRLWIWGHPAGVYNDSFLAPLGRKSSIEPVDAAERLGLQNVLFVRYDGRPEPPFGDDYAPFRRLDRVYWSLVAAGGLTSDREREHAFALAEAETNVAGFILDDFFHGHVTGRAGTAPAEPWLAENGCRFPVTLTLTPPGPASADALELTQTDWPTGDYRTKGVAVDVSADGRTFREAAAGELPNEPGAALRLNLPAGEFAALRLRLLGTHDTKNALSCGLSAVRLVRSGQVVTLADWKAGASSSFAGFDPAAVLGGVTPFRASLTPEELRELRRKEVRGRRLPLMAVVYTGQISPRAKAHLDEVDEVCLWTWRPADLEHLEANLTALEVLVPGKPVLLGCYTYDFADSRPLPVELMRRQTEQGYGWLEEGRIKGMIFLASANMDVGLEAVEWTRQWIKQVGDEPLELRKE